MSAVSRARSSVARILPVLALLAAAGSILAVSAARPAHAGIRIAALRAGADVHHGVEGLAEVVGDVAAPASWSFFDARAEWAPALVEAARRAGMESPRAIVGRTGGARGRLVVVVDEGRLAVRGEPDEPSELTPAEGAVPLVVSLHDRASGIDLTLVAADLADLDGEARAVFASRIAAWAAQHPEPLVVTTHAFEGVRLDESRRGPGHARLVGDGGLLWVRPSVMARTSCHFASKAAMRDFVYVGGAARDWEGEAEIPFDTADFCERYSPACCWAPPRCRGECGPPHVPVVVTLEPVRLAPSRATSVPSAWSRAPAVPQDMAPGPSRDELLRRIEALERRVRELEERVGPRRR